jgi:hypothetical protein
VSASRPRSPTGSYATTSARPATRPRAASAGTRAGSSAGPRTCEAAVPVLITGAHRRWRGGSHPRCSRRAVRSGSTATGTSRASAPGAPSSPRAPPTTRATSSRPSPRSTPWCTSVAGCSPRHRRPWSTRPRPWPERRAAPGSVAWWPCRSSAPPRRGRPAPRRERRGGGAARAAPVPTVVVRVSLVDTPAIRDALATAGLSADELERPIAPVRPTDVVGAARGLRPPPVLGELRARRLHRRGPDADDARQLPRPARGRSAGPRLARRPPSARPGPGADAAALPHRTVGRRHQRPARRVGLHRDRAGRRRPGGDPRRESRDDPFPPWAGVGEGVGRDHRER